MSIYENYDQAKAALILACIPLPPAFVVGPFIIQGVTSVLGWVEVALLLMLWNSMSPNFILRQLLLAERPIFNTIFGVALLLALIGCFIYGIILTAEEAELRAPAEIDPLPKE